MADRKITDLTALAAGSQATGDLLTIVDVSESAAADKNKKITMENLFKGIPGDVGIGTSSPAERLHVYHPTANVNAVIESGDANAYLSFKDSSTTSTSHVYLGAAGNDMQFATSTAEKMRIDSSGNVGIGVSSPAHELHVADASTPEIVVEDTTNNCKAYLGSSDTNGRIGTLSNHDLAFRTNDIERMRIDSSGNIGIGTTNPGSVTGSGIDLERSGPATLRLNDTSGNGAVVEIYADDGVMSAVYDSRGNSANHGHQFRINGSEKARIDSSGRLLLGASSSVAPNRKFQIAGLANMSICSNVNSSDGVTVDYIKSRNTTYGSNTIVQDGDTIAKIQFRGDDGSDYLTQAAQIAAEVDGTPGSNDMPGRLVFLTTADGASSPTERMRIDSSGQVGIGTTSADAKLHAHITTADDNIAKFSGSNFNRALLVKHTSDGINLVTTEETDESDADRALIFSRGATETMRIDSSGRVLIGKTSAGDFTTGVEFQPAGAVLAYRTSAVAGIFGRTDNGETVRFTNSGSTVGTISTTGSATAYNTSSDYRLKENVVDLDGAITRVKQLAPKRFNFIADDTTTVDGFLAHEAQTVVPEAVTGTHNEVDDDGNAVMQGIDQSKLVPLLTAALKEAIAKIETLETKVAALEAQ